MAKELKITTRLIGNMMTCQFDLGKKIHDRGPVFFHNKKEAAAAPIAKKLFAIGGISAVKISRDRVDVSRSSYENWPAVTRPVAKLLAKHAASKEPFVGKDVPSNMPSSKEIKAKAEKVLAEQINPGVASHGGEISILDIKDATIYVKLGGGCHGCASAAMTLKQGVERAFRDAIPELDEVLDTTDHAAGKNPHYAGGEGHGH